MSDYYLIRSEAERLRKEQEELLQKRAEIDERLTEIKGELRFAERLLNQVLIQRTAEEAVRQAKDPPSSSVQAALDAINHQRRQSVLPNMPPISDDTEPDASYASRVLLAMADGNVYNSGDISKRTGISALSVRYAFKGLSKLKKIERVGSGRSGRYRLTAEGFARVRELQMEGRTP